MPITDYKAVEAVLVVAPLMWRLRAYWSRVINRGPDSVEGHRLRP